MERLDRKAVLGWSMYDWANSAFATTVMAGFFPIFFKQYWSTGADATVSTARLGLANSLSGILIAVVAPLLGAIADKSAARKKFLFLFASLGIVMTASLFFVSAPTSPLPSSWFPEDIVLPIPQPHSYA